MTLVKSRQRVADHGEVFTPLKQWLPVTVEELAECFFEGHQVVMPENQG